MGRWSFRLLFFLIFVLIPLVLAVVLTRQAAPPELSLKKTEFSSLEGWDDSGHAVAFEAFLKSCEKLTPRPGFLTPQAFQTETFVRTFQDACAKGVEGKGFYSESDASARGFFEDNFDPYQMRLGWSRTGKITGYYEPLMEASFEASAEFQYPIYANPGDQVRIDLSRFRDDLSGTLIGRLQGSTVLPYYTRRDISEGALKGKDLEILYAKDPVDVYFLQVQGSGRAKLPDGTIIGVGYAGKNGRQNTLAGRTLVELEEMALEEVSMQSIRQWFEDHPERVDEILHRDDSYVFFHITGGDGPFGSSGAVLTPEHSLAVDPDFIPMGIPVFVEGEVPTYGSQEEEELEPFREILIAQDTGGVIRGAIRGDVFWGNGDKAEYMAGHMNNEAKFTLLLPKSAFGDDE